MNADRSPESLAAISREITRSQGKSFYFASHVLPSGERSGSYDIYALCRIIDDATDNKVASTPDALVGHELSTQLVSFLYSNHSNPDKRLNGWVVKVINATAPLQISALNCESYLNYLRQRLQSLGISRTDLEDLLLGQLDDENFVQPLTFSAFYQYCYRVAGVVGHMMALVLGATRDRATRRAAEHLGVAMQITNILRDVKEDLEQRQRIYLPADICNQYGVDFNAPMSALANGHASTALLRYIGQIGLWYYESGLNGSSGIQSRRGRLCVKLMTAIYGSILAKVIASPDQVFRGRTVTHLASKIWIALQVICGRNPLRAAGFTHELLRMNRTATPIVQEAHPS
jgi:phytoene synthase